MPRGFTKPLRSNSEWNKIHADENEKKGDGRIVTQADIASEVVVYRGVDVNGNQVERELCAKGWLKMPEKGVKDK